MSGHTITRRRPTFATIPRALLRDPGLSNGAKLVYALLDDYSSPDGPLPFPSQETLAKLLGGVTERCVRNWLTELREAGWIAVHRRPGSSGNEYDLQDRPEPQFRTDRNHSSGATGTTVPPKKNHEGEPEKDNPPNPPAGGDEGRLFADPKPAPDRKAKKAKTERGKFPPDVVARFELWAELYPKGSQRGDTAAALKAFAKALEGGTSTGEMEDQLANYVAARDAYRQYWGVPTALMRMATFLNGKRSMWARPWTFEDLQYWPPPPGKVWGLAPAGAGTESIMERRKRLIAEDKAREAAEAEAEAAGEDGIRGVA